MVVFEFKNVEGFSEVFNIYLVFIVIILILLNFFGINVDVLYLIYIFSGIFL